MAKLAVKLTKTDEGLLAQCVDNRSFIVFGKNKSEVRTELKNIITGYVKIFPNEKDKFFTGNKLHGVSFIED